MKKRCALSLYPVEQLLLFALLLTIFLYQFVITGLREPVLLYWQRISSGFLCYALGLFLTFWLRRVAELHRTLFLRGPNISLSASWQEFRIAFLRFSPLQHDLRLVHALSVLFVLFIEMKHLTPFLSQQLFDASLLRGEELLFGGVLAAQWLRQILGDSVARVLSDSYELWYAFMGLVIVFFICQRNRMLTQKFAFSFALLWILGALLIYVFPTWGPCFFVPERFQELPLTEMKDFQAKLWRMKLALDREPQHAHAVFLISGFPSLHMAVTVLASLWLQKKHWFLATLSWIFAAITSLNTLYFGWHYLLDNVGAVALALLVLWLSEKIFQNRDASVYE